MGIESSLATFVPADVRSAIVSGVTPAERRHGSVLEADVSGFTPLTEALAQRHGPQRGAEEVAAVLDRVYAPLITEVDRAGGSVVELLGDAIACCFDADDGTSALRCGLAMQQAIASRRRDGAAPPAVKVVVATGSFLRFSVGDPRIRLMEVLAGPAVAGLAAIAPLARGGEVVVDAQTAARLGASGVRSCSGSCAPSSRCSCDSGPSTTPATSPARRSTPMRRFAQETIEGLGGTLFNVAVDAKGC